MRSAKANRQGASKTRRTKVAALSPCLLVSLSPWLAPSACLASEPAGGYRNGVVVCVSAPGAEVGRAVLRQGGNAVDAAVATAFALAVTYPPAGNIGGGGFMLIHPPGGKPVVIDYRETAPAAATANLFVKSAPRYGPLTVGVPGTVRGLALAHRRFGKLPWKDVVLPAVRLANEGFAVDNHLARSLNRILADAGDFAELQRVFAGPQARGAASARRSWRAGDHLVQKDLARTLRHIAEDGPDAFYHGPIAGQIVAEMKAGGLVTPADLAGYRARERQPIHGTYRGYDVYAPPPPSSGGVCLVEMLNILETFDLRKEGRWSPRTWHLMIEAMRRAYCDRARYLGDPDFVKIPAHLTTREYARKLAAQIDLERATPSERLAPDIRLAPEGSDTTHLSVIDRAGLAVANTYTLEQSYGARVLVKGAGFLLNNEMGDFNRRPGWTDRTGAIGTAANVIAPGKRMLSSQTPTIVARDGKVILVTGSPGGRTIINTVLCVLVNVLDFDLDLRAAVDAPRLHHQWLPDRAVFEAAFARPAVLDRLRRMGHAVTSEGRQGDAHSIQTDPRSGRYVGVADRRLSGSVAGY